MSSGVPQKDCADRLGLTARHLRNLVRDGSLPAQDADGLHPWPATRDAYNAYIRAQEAAKAAPTDIEAWRARKLAAEALREEHALKMDLKRAVSVEALDTVVGEIADRIRAVCINLPTTFGLELERAGVPADVAEATLEQIGVRVMDSFRGVADVLDAVPYEDEAAGTAGDGDGSGPAA